VEVSKVYHFMQSVLGLHDCKKTQFRLVCPPPPGGLRAHANSKHYCAHVDLAPTCPAPPPTRDASLNAGRDRVLVFAVATAAFANAGKVLAFVLPTLRAGLDQAQADMAMRASFDHI
jgi:hypothetical protein